MRSINSLLRVAALAVALMAIPAVAAAQSTEAPDLHLMSGLLNFTRGQAVSIDFCNVARVARNARLYVVDMDGNVLKTSSELVAPGQSVSLNFSYGELPRSMPARAGIRGVVVVVAPPDADPPDAELALASVQIYDVSGGKTLIGLLMPAVKTANVYFPTDQ